MGWYSWDRIHEMVFILIPSAPTDFMSYLDRVHNSSVILYCAHNGAFFTL